MHKSLLHLYIAKVLTYLSSPIFLFSFKSGENFIYLLSGVLPFLNFILNVTFIDEGMHTHVGLQLGWEGSGMEKVRHTFQSFVFLLGLGGVEVGGIACYQTTSTSGDRGQFFDDMIENLTWGRIFWECCLSGVNSSETLLVNCSRVWEHFSKVYGLTNSTLVFPQTREHAAKFAEETCPTYSVFHSLMKQLISHAGIDESTVKSSVYICLQHRHQ